MRIIAAALFVSSVALGACGPSGRETEPGDDDPIIDGGIPGRDTPVTPGPSLVYAHSGSTLYRVDSTTLNAQMIGVMGGLGGGQLLDLAVNEGDNIVGATGMGLYSINATTGAATQLASVTGDAVGMSSLSYVPLPSGEILISANNAGKVFKITITGSSATAAEIGNYGKYNGNQISSSGDIFGVDGFGIYATVNIEGEDNDYLAKLNPNLNWKAEIIGPIGYDKVFGLGFWGGKIYGFIDNDTGGVMIDINATTGAGSQLATNNVRWYGAGVTTDAPIIQ